MGAFSWMDCLTGEQILNYSKRPVYLLIPKRFGGGHIEEPCYTGDGMFGADDVYELVPKWNKKFIPIVIEHAAHGNWSTEGYCPRMVESMLAYYHDEPGKVTVPVRDIGILLACYDEDNARLPYPIKITYDPDAVYEACGPSLGDPDQGFPAGDEEEEDDDAAYSSWRDNLLSERLMQHFGHHVEISVYGDADDPECVCLECTDCNEVIFDDNIYTLCGREDV